VGSSLNDSNQLIFSGAFSNMEVPVILARFYSALIRLALFLALMGQLKTCTLNLLDLAHKSSKTGIMSYSRFTKTLTE